ncbi:hypothetical protein [Mucilaginibacter sp.]|uniref:hypothetical protein n=1 Tax=Mucilaginibacter sp. TaxID=1882438 RepID=UPI00284ECE6F|nr:hypothetical protein [Mucilaginibacter sp.]MDR3693369.1 hypothetical protein [Mucilaginibacter sp.]
MTKKYILKPGKHQFASGSHAMHDNDNLSDEEAEWYLQRYPHIAVLFEDCPANGHPEIPEIILPEVNEMIPGEQSPDGDGLPNQ